MSDKWDSHDGRTHSEHSQEHHHKNATPAHTEVVNPVHVVAGQNIIEDTSPIDARLQPQKPSIGRIVHFVLDGGPNKGEHRPAIIVRVWPEHGGIQHINLQVFTDGSNDGEGYKHGIYWATSVEYADPSENKPYSWHWPERE